MKDILAKFSEVTLKGQQIPDDLQKLFRVQVLREPSGNEYADPLESTGIRILEPGSISKSLTHSYLNDNDRANPDTMANVAAINEVFEFITFVAEDVDGQLFGYWQGSEKTPLLISPIVKYGSEGQFEILKGANFTEAIIADSVRGDEQEFVKSREWFANLGISVSTSLDLLFVPDLEIEPRELHSSIYESKLASKDVVEG
jgi:hypothetical protein